MENDVVEVKDINDWTLVRFTEKSLNERYAPAVEQQLNHLIEPQDRRKLFLDFTNVTFFASRGVVLLLSIRKKLESMGGQLILANLSPSVLDVFQTLRLDKVFDIRQHVNPESELT